MDEITVENFRCFREKQTVRLAPLTLLVGENSTGKTSFLALIKALADVGFGFRIPDFKNAPYDLGSFDEIAHHRGARGSRAEQFKAGFRANARGSPRHQTWRLAASSIAPRGKVYSTRQGNDFNEAHKKLLDNKNLCKMTS